MSYPDECFAPTCHKKPTKKWQYKDSPNEYVYTCDTCLMGGPNWTIAEVIPLEPKVFEPTRGPRRLP